MFKNVAALWDQYCKAHATVWPAEDARHPLSAEVKARFEQLDLILDHLHRALNDITPDPEVTAHNAAWVVEKGPLLGSGQMSDSEYVAGIRSEQRDPTAYRRAWNEVRLFTEAFYLIAWRLREILCMALFPGLSIDAPGVRQVRNLLIEHPEHGRPEPNYAQSLVVTSDGPVLKSSEFVVHPAQGRTSASAASLDKGLFKNAESFRADIEVRLRKVLATESR